MYNRYKYELMPLNYSKKALEPQISAETLKFHHGKHLQTYVDNLNKTLVDYPEYQAWTLEKLLYNLDSLPKEIQEPVRNNGGGVYNHNLYFQLLAPHSEAPTGEFLYAINSTFGAVDEMLAKLKSAALKVFGSGYAWVVTDKAGNLTIAKTPNQDTLISKNLHPVLVVDVWEHAYYLQYQNRRAEYLDNWATIINWEKAQVLYESRKSIDYSML